MKRRLERVVSVEPLRGFTVRIVLTSGKAREVDLDKYLRGPVFEPLRRHAALFRQVRVDLDLGTLVWPNGADICPDVLIHGRPPARAPRRSPQRARR